jgi:hypothetical protein
MASSFGSLCHSCSLQWIDHSNIQSAIQAISPAWEQNISWSPVNTWKEEASLAHWTKCCSLCNREDVIPDGVVPGDALTIVATAERMVTPGIAELLAGRTWTITVINIYPQSVPCCQGELRRAQMKSKNSNWGSQKPAASVRECQRIQPGNLSFKTFSSNLLL